ncbi:MAG: SUMF1/EgtB/PvdO family nonheme iron enzyme [Solirubrobacteraceae bacterium]
MATTATSTSRPGSRSSAAQALEDLRQTRRSTLALVAALSDEELERVHSPIMSPLVWDLGHIAAYEDLWLAHRHGGMPLLRPELADCYDAFETPRAVRGEIEVLGPADARAYLQAVRARTVEVIAREGIGDGVVCEMVLRHELQHTETMRQTMAIADLLPPGERLKADRPIGPAQEVEEWIEIPAGSFAMGADPDVFAYDNERPRHTVHTPAYRIARRPVSCASWLRFSEDGGYEERGWWSAEGWAWREGLRGSHHPAIATSHPQAAACHISWFEAEAFARANGARLPTEAEWERAARLPAQTPGRQVSAAGCAGALTGVGQVWEWTQSAFRGYPGFVAYPYREYSEVFFGEDYRVLRGGSWATSPRVRSPAFRNWDLPQRRQIFAGLRLARDAS